ncbi:unnamed protein product, partial [Ectocarpus fasciculatus]
WADGKRLVCTEHKDDLTEGLVIDFGRRCSVAGMSGCRKTAKWGMNGEHPTHCDKHSEQIAQSVRLVRIPSSRGTSTYSSSPGTTVGRCRAAEGGEGGRSGDHGVGEVKRARKVPPPGGQLTSGARW